MWWQSYSWVALWQPQVFLASLAAAIGYLVVTGPVGRRFSESYRVTIRQRLAFLGAVAVQYLTFGSPLDVLADHYLFSAHMVQHMLETVVMAPLLLLGLPDWCLRPLWRFLPTRLLLKGTTRPFVALLLFNAVFSVSHVPVWYDATLRNETLHFFEHAVFLVTALMFWWPIFSPLPERPRLHPAMQMVYLFIGGMAMTPVFAVLIFATHPLYSGYLHVPRLYGLSPLADQILGGIIMKMSAMIAYGMVFFYRLFQWLGESRRLTHEESEAAVSGNAEVEQGGSTVAASSASSAP